MSAYFRFKMSAVPKDQTGYYYPKWDTAQPITVIAHNREEAAQKASVALGESEQGWPWFFRHDSIEEIEPAQEPKQ